MIIVLIITWLFCGLIVSNIMSLYLQLSYKDLNLTGKVYLLLLAIGGYISVYHYLDVVRDEYSEKNK